MMPIKGIITKVKIAVMAIMMPAIKFQILGLLKPGTIKVKKVRLINGGINNKPMK
jgi:hypothetical protein